MDENMHDIVVVGTTIFDGKLEYPTKEIRALCDRVRSARVRKYPDVWRISDSLDSSIIKAALENVINAYDESHET